MILALLLALSLGPPVLTPAEIDRVLRGEVLARSDPSITPDGKTSGYGVGAIEIDRPVDEIWKVLANYDDKAEYQPRVQKCTVVHRDGDVLRVAMVVDATIMTVSYTGIYTLDPAAHSVHWILDRQAAGNTIQYMDGGYALIPVTQTRTILYFKTFVDSGHLIPHFLQNYFGTVRAIPDLLRAIKMRVESGGTWHK